MPTPSQLLQAAVITLLILAFIGLLRFFTVQTHFFDPFNSGVQDYEVTDIFFSRLKDTARVMTDPRIVLVHVEHPQRAEIARLLDRISAQAPGAVGIDILFPGRKTAREDSLLAAALAATPNLVLAGNLMEYDKGREGIPGMITSDTLFARHGTTAYTNFLTGNDRTVRQFSPQLNTLDSERHTSFAAAVVQQYAPQLANRLLRRRGNAERINYFGDYRSFIRIDADEVLAAPVEELGLFRSRIVLVGYAHNSSPAAPLEDRHFTPLNPVYTGRSLPDMYGMVIHANTIHMILDGAYIHDAPNWALALFNVVFIFFNVLIIHRIYHRLTDTFHGVTRLLQLAESVVIFFLVAVLFVAFRLEADITLGLLGMLLAYDVVMIYENLLKKRIPYIKNLSYEQATLPPPAAVLGGDAGAMPE